MLSNAIFQIGNLRQQPCPSWCNLCTITCPSVSSSFCTAKNKSGQFQEFKKWAYWACLAYIDNCSWCGLLYVIFSSADSPPELLRVFNNKKTKMISKFPDLDFFLILLTFLSHPNRMNCGPLWVQHSLVPHIVVAVECHSNRIEAHM